MRKFKIENVHCQNCVNLIKNSLQNEWGALEFEENFTILKVNINDDKIEFLREALQELGFKLLDEI